MLLPGRCPLCRRVGPSPCAACASQLEQAPSLPGTGRCGAVPGHWGRVQGRGQGARGQVEVHATARWTMSDDQQIAGLIDGQDAAVVTWIPTTSRRRRQRGFDQAELLARGVARRLRLPCRALLRRADDSPQTGRSGIGARRSVVRVARAARRAAVERAPRRRRHHHGIDRHRRTARALAGAGVTHVSARRSSPNTAQASARPSRHSGAMTRMHPPSIAMCTNPTARSWRWSSSTG